MKYAFLLLLACTTAIAADLKLKDYQWTVTDIASRGLKKENLFSSMDRDFVKPGKSICSNRALMWANNFKNQHNIDTAKIFLFYTKKKGDMSLKTWWYHVSPVVNENGNLFVMDAGFGSWINSPLTKDQWLFKFSNSNNCKEINANETELVEMIFKGQVFPHETSYGNYDCYYKFVPHTIWTPDILASNLLGRDSDGRPSRVERNAINSNELYQACLEATTTSIGYAMGTNKKECKQYAGIAED
jgi:hypothetical protein